MFMMILDEITIGRETMAGHPPHDGGLLAGGGGGEMDLMEGPFQTNLVRTKTASEAGDYSAWLAPHLPSLRGPPFSACRPPRVSRPMT